MNKLCYRVIFSKTRQMLMVVSELANSHTAGKVREENPAQTSPSSRRVSLLPLILSVSLALGLVSQPGYANIVADPHAPGKEQPTVISSANGVPQVNIQTPNPDGVSRNQYRQFDVEQKGAILNNSAVNTKTDLAGHITGNPWLAQGEAKIILNEVNSRDPSQLNGFVEVAGKRADVIIANPAGITCRGCGFINAQQTTLAAGQTVLENGRLKGFEVNNGRITVDGKGLNDTQSDHTRLIARAVDMNAKLHAQHLTVTTGKNRVDAQGNVVQTRGSPAQEKPEFSLDVSAIGGMYANKIKLVGTEQGVGVRNAGHLGAQAGELVLDSNGKLTNTGSITAATAVTLRNQGNFVNQGKVQAHDLAIHSDGHLTNSGVMGAEKSISLTNQGRLANQGEINAGQDMTVQARDQLDNQGKILSGRHLAIQSTAFDSGEKSVLMAGVHKDGRLAQPGKLTIDSHGRLTNKGVMAASEDATFTTQGDWLNQGQVQAKSLTVRSDGHLTNHGVIHAKKAVSLTNQGQLANQGDITAGEGMTLTARDSLTNQGKLRAGHRLTIQSAGVDNQKSGVLRAGVNKASQLTMDSRGRVTNQGRITASEDIDLKSQTEADNQGEITADRDMTLRTPGQVTNAGKMLAGRHLAVHGSTFDNQVAGALAAGVDTAGKLTQPGTLNIQTEGAINNQGLVTAAEGITLQNHNTLHNQGEMTAGRDLSVKIRDQFSNQGKMRADRHLTVHSATLDNGKKGVLAAGMDKNGPQTQSGQLTLNSLGPLINKGVIAASGAATFTTQGDWLNQGQVQATALTVSSDGHLTNHGVINAKKAVSLTNQGRLANQGDITAGEDMALTARDQLTNQGKLRAGHRLTIQSAGVDNQQHGVLRAGVNKASQLTMDSRGRVTNQGLITASEDIDLQSQTEADNQGEITADRDMTLRTPGQVVNAGKMLAGRHLAVHGSTFDNQVAGALAAGVDKTGTLTQSGTLNIQTEGAINNDGILTASEEVDLLNNNSLHNQGDIRAGQNLAVTIRDQLGNQGKMQAGRHLTVHSTALDNGEKGILAAGLDNDDKLTQPGNLALNSRGKLTNQGIMAASEEATFTTQGDWLNQGLVQATSLTIRSDGNLSNPGKIAVSKDATFQNQGSLTNQGNIAAGRDITITTREQVNNQGHMLAGRHLTSQSITFMSQTGSTLAAGVDDEGKLTRPGHLTISAHDAASLHGQHLAHNDLAITAHDIDMSGSQAGAKHLQLTSAKRLNLQAATLSAQHNLTLTAPELIDNQRGELSADTLVLNSRQLKNTRGKITQTGDASLVLDHQDGIDNTDGVITANGQDLVLKSQTIASEKGTLHHAGAGELSIETPQFQGRASRLLSGGKLTLTGGDYALAQSQTSARHITADIQSLDHRLGEMTQHGNALLSLNVKQGLDNASGRIAANGSVALRADSLNNSTLTDNQLSRQKQGSPGSGLENQALTYQPGYIIAAEDGQLDVTVANHLNNQTGQLLASHDIHLSGQSIDNQQGHITSSAGGIQLTTSQLDNQSGRIVGQHILRLKTQGINNEKGQIQGGTVDIETAQQRLNNQSGRVVAEHDLVLSTGEVLNRHGLIQSGQHLRLNTHGHTLDNRDSGQASGLISRRGEMLLTTGDIHNQSGYIGSHDRLSVTGNYVTNQDGQILGGKATSLTATALNNEQGLLQSGGTLALNTQSLINRQSGSQHGITSKQAMTLETDTLDNLQGVIVSADSLNIKAGQVNNSQGQLAAKKALDLHSLALNNSSGRIQADEALSVDTGGKGLNNTDGVLDSQQTLTVRSGDLTNHGGMLHGKSAVRLGATQLDNRHGGKVLSEQTLDIDAQTLRNTQGHLLALRHLNATATEQIDNTDGLIRSGGDIRLNAARIENANTRRADKGIDGQHVTLTGRGLNNRQGQLTALRNATLTLTHSLDNTRGQLQAHQHLSARGDRLALTNTGGDIRAGQTLSISGVSATGDGKLHSLGDITLNVQNGFIHTGETIANGRLQLDTQGDVVNHSLISADTLHGRAAKLTNHAPGEILANHHQWLVKGNLYNAGLMDGTKTILKADTLTNQASGRIYGDQVAIEAKTLNNLPAAGIVDALEKWRNQKNTGKKPATRYENLVANSQSAVIAARQRLDIGVETLNNQTHSLIYSDGELAVGGGLDNQQRPTGQGRLLNNLSASIESAGNMRLAMNTINNVNDHQETELALVSQTPEVIYQMRGNRYNPKDYPMYIGREEVALLCFNGEHCSTDNDVFQTLSYTRTVQESRVTATDPAKILAGKNLTLETAKIPNGQPRLKNHHSQIVAGGALTVTGGEVENTQTPGQRHITDQGQVESFWRIRKKGRDKQGWEAQPYQRSQVQDIQLKTSTLDANQGQIAMNGQSPGHYQGRTTQMAPADQRQIEAFFVSGEAKTPEIVQRPGQQLDVVSQQPASAGEKPWRVRTETPDYRLPNNSLFKLNLSSDGQSSTLTRTAPTDDTQPVLALDLSSLTPLTRTPSSGSQQPELPLAPPSSRHSLTPPPVPEAQVLIETDPRFTQYKRWLGTDYMQNSLRWDHNNMHKRLGDGFYEQRLIRDQIINLTGQRYLSGYQNDEEQFKALMNAGIRAQKAFNLTPGVALSASQMARLTENMVWLVKTSVRLPDGSQQMVLAPQVYVRTQGSQLDGSGALMSGQQVNMQLSGNWLNQGNVTGQQLHVLADTIRHQGGSLQGDKVSLQARTDVIQRGGVVTANDLRIQANRNIDIASTTHSGEQRAGSSRYGDTYVNHQAGIYVEGADGKLRLQAGQDVKLTAAQLTAQHKNSQIQMNADRNIELGAVKTTQDEQVIFSGNNRITRHASQDVGTVIHGAGQVELRAGRDMSLKAGEVTAGDRLHANAGRDIRLLAGEQQQRHDEYLKVKGSNSWLASGTTTTQHQFDRQQALSSQLSGESVTMQAGQDVLIGGSHVIGTQDVDIRADRHLTVTTAQEHNRELSRQEEKKSGLMGTGGIGFMIGSQSMKQSSAREDLLHKGSTVGSSDGNVVLSAKNQATIQGSDIVAGKNLFVQGQDVAMTAVQNRHTAVSQTEQQQSGLTVSLGGTVGSALNTAVQTAQEARDSKNNQDRRLQALKNTQATLSGAQALQAWQLSEAQSAKAEAINQAGGKAEKPTDVVGVQLSLGSQSSKSETRRAQTVAQGSTLNAGQDIRITATGETEKPRASGDIQVQGSTLNAGQDITLTANRDIALTSAENTQTLRGQNSSKGGNIGLGLTAGQGGTGLKFSAGVNTGKGHETGDTLTHTETQFTAGNQVALNAGQDALLKGAQVSGNKVTANVGRNLHLASEQDRDNYHSKQQNVSAGASFTYGSMTGSASANASREKMDSHYQSVKEQTGIFAGQGGFDIQVGNHTQLDGAVMASTAGKDKNRLETGTLGFGDIQNKAAFKTEQQSTGMSTGGAVGNQLVSNMASNMLSGTGNQGSKTSTTQAAVSEGTLIVRDSGKQHQDVNSLRRDPENAANSLAPIFDKEKEQQRLAQAQAIANIGTQVLDIYNTQEAIAATQKATADLKNPQNQQHWKAQARKQLEQENVPVTAEALADRTYQLAYNEALQKQGADIGGNRRQAVSAVVSVLQGLAGGDIKAAMAGGAAPYLANAVKAATYGNTGYEKLTPEQKATNLLAHAILGGVIAEMKSGSAIAGATGAVGGELAASAIAHALYPGKKFNELTPDEKEKISNLSTLAGGIAAGLATNSTAGGIDGAQTAKNAIENNYLSVNELDNFAHKARTCEGNSCKQVIKDMVETNVRNQQEMMDFCNSNPTQCAQKYGYLVDQWPVFERTLKNMDRDGTLPVEFRNYLSAVNTLGQAATGKVGELGWTKRFEAMGMSQETAAAMAMTLPIVIEGAKGPKSSPKSSQNNAGKGAQPESAGKNTSGAENAATYPKLKEDLVQRNLSHIASQDPRLAAVVKGDNGKLNYGIGAGTRAEADRLGKIWVGDGAKKTTGNGWVSADGTRGYRPPSEKPNSAHATTGVQANFETYSIDSKGKINKTGNGHLNILD